MACILVIEDEPVVRAITRRMLVENGHQVVEAGSAHTGCEALREMHVDLVLTDVHLGADDGITTMSQIRRSHPELPLIAVSGGFEGEVSDRLEDAGLRAGVRSLAKPFTCNDLLVVVEEALAG
ncbi:MAG: response regulator [Gemmatimonadales bacterium]